MKNIKKIKEVFTIVKALVFTVLLLGFNQSSLAQDNSESIVLTTPPPVNTVTTITQTTTNVRIREIFVSETTEGGEDEVYLKVWVDDIEQPIVGPHSMNEDDDDIESWTPNLVYDFTSNFKIEIWEEDTNADDLIGSYSIAVSDADREITKNFTGGGSQYKLTLSKNSNQETTRSNICAVAVIDRIDSIKASDSTDSALIEALSGFAAEYYAAGGQVISAVGTLAGQPEIAVVGDAIAAMSKPIKEIPAVASAIDAAGDWADDLYLSLSSDAEDDVAFWPASNENYNLKTTSTTNTLSGGNRFVPYILGMIGPDDTIDVIFWEFDTLSGDDQMGKIRFSLTEADARPRVNLVVSEKNGGSIYGVAYRVVPVECPVSVAGAYRSIAQGGEPVTKAQQYNSLFRQLLVTPGGIADQLGTKGIN